MNPYLQTRYFFDFVLSFFLVFTSIPLLVIIVIFQILLYGPDNVFFIQQRIGILNKPFNLIKLKTMNNNLNIPETKRLTGLGKILRRWGLDEIPQLINVLKGEMAIIGPRPLLPEYLPYYSDEQLQRHQIKPGIIGLAQACGRNASSWEQRLILDVEYVKMASLKLDIEILLKTVKTITSREGNTEILPRFDEYIRGQASQ